MKAAPSDRERGVDSAALEADLATLGIRCRVEARDRLALVVPRDGYESLADPELRRKAMRMAEAHGFSHLALELPDDEPGAAESERS